MTTLLRIIALAFLLASGAFAAELRDYAPEQIAPHTWVIHGPLGDPSVANQGFINNPAFVITADSVVVIDPGSSEQAGRMVLRQIKKLTDKPISHVLNTHVHGDHWLGNQAIVDAYPKVQLMAHPTMIRAAHEGATATWLALMNRMTQGFTHDTRPAVPTIPVLDNQVFIVGGVEFRILAPEKAHSHTDIMIELPGDSVLFLGDNVMNGRFGMMRDGTFQGNIAACNRALASTAKVFVPGHGRSGSRAIVVAFRDYLATVLATVKRELEAGKRDYEMKDTARKAVARYSNWIGFESNFGPHISVAVQELEAL